LREKYPVVEIGRNKCKVSYDADHKLELYIRDMNPAKENKEAEDIEFDDGYCIFVRGTPLKVLEFCTKELKDGKDILLTDEKIAEIKARINVYEMRGDSCYGLARLKLDP
jgi:magnesium-transporting ATPase (P-type)